MFLTVGDPASSRPVALRVNFVHKRVFFLIVRHTLLTAPEQCGSASFTAAVVMVVVVVVVVVASGLPLSQPQQYSSSPTQLLCKGTWRHRCAPPIPLPPSLLLHHHLITCTSLSLSLALSLFISLSLALRRVPECRGAASHELQGEGGSS